MTKAMRLRAKDEMVERLRGASGLILVDPQRMTSQQANELRGEIRGSGGRIRLLKNAVAVHALQELGHAKLAERVGGMSAVVWASDPIAPLKVLFGYRAKNKVPEIRGGSIDGEIADAARLEALSKLPSRHELLGSFVGTLAAPITSYLCVLNNIAGQFVQVLDAIRRKKEA